MLWRPKNNCENLVWMIEQELQSVTISQRYFASSLSFIQKQTTSLLLSNKSFCYCSACIPPIETVNTEPEYMFIIKTRITGKLVTSYCYENVVTALLLYDFFLLLWNLLTL